MLPVIYKWTFQTDFSKVVLYLMALGLVVYSAWSGWRGAAGPPDPKTGELTLPSQAARQQRAIQFGIFGFGLAAFGLYYALPELPIIGRGKGEGLPIHTYGILVGGGFIAAVTASSWLAQREWPGELGIKRRDQVMDLAFYVFIGAMVGSRVLFTIVNWKDFVAAPSVFGGLVFQGGLIGASLVAYWYCKKNEIDFLRLADIGLPTVSLGSALGRLGCFSAGCCWGRPTHAAWAVHFPGAQKVTNLLGGATDTPSLAWSSMKDDHRWIIESTGEIFHQAVPGAVQISQWVTEHQSTLGIHPTQLYESLLQLGLFVAMISLRPFRRFHGQIAGIWLMLYAIVRSTVELFRGDVERGTLHGALESNGLSWLSEKVPLEAWYNISTSQFGSIALFSLGAFLLIRQFRSFQRSQPRFDATVVASA